jgi:hypothetical protein
MKEAYEYRNSPLVYGIVRRIELAKWPFIGKWWHPNHRWYARPRALLLFLSGHETEVCYICGGKVGLVWWCADEKLWSELTGESNGGGTTCVNCFDRLCEESGKGFLRWNPTLQSRE